MIIKICEEIVELRIRKDYKNYRNLTNILKEYVCDLIRIPSDYFEVPNREEYDIKVKPIKMINKWIEDEIILVTELLNSSLKYKNYGDFKILSQSDLMLKYMHNRIKDSRIL